MGLNAFQAYRFVSRLGTFKSVIIYAFTQDIIYPWKDGQYTKYFTKLMEKSALSQEQHQQKNINSDKQWAEPSQWNWCNVNDPYLYKSGFPKMCKISFTITMQKTWYECNKKIECSEKPRKSLFS